MTCTRAGLLAFAAAVALAAPAGAGAAVTTDVDARSNIFAAGLAAVPPFTGGGGLLPPVVSLDGAATVVFPSVTGTWTCVTTWPPFYAPDGDCFGDTGDTKIDSVNSIAGFFAASEGPLVGVFLGPDPPAGPAPPPLDFRTGAIGEQFFALAPSLRQPFFVGDGIMGPGLRQRFTVPAGATRLFLGMADADSFVGNPGWYNDNSGVFRVSVSSLVTTCTPTAFGTSADDTVTLGSANDAYDALAGNDAVNAGSGNDCIHGGAGDDGISGGSGDDQLDGGSGNDTVAGGSGNDRIAALAGTDSVDGGSGNDRIDVRDGAGGDAVDCGGDHDRYRADPGDIIAADCEQSSEIL